MDRKADHLLPPTAPSNPIRPIAGEANLTANTTSSSSSSASASLSPSDFLRHVHAAVFKRHRPLGTMQSKVSRATRIMVPQTESSKNSTHVSSFAGRNVGKKFSQSGGVAGTEKLHGLGLERRKGTVADVGTNPPEDSSLTPPSFTGTITSLHDDNIKTFETQKDGDKLLVGDGKASLAIPSSQSAPLLNSVDDLRKKLQLPFAATASSALQSYSYAGEEALSITDNRMDDISSYLRSLTLTEVENGFNIESDINCHGPEQQNVRDMEVSGISIKFGDTDLIEKRNEAIDPQHSTDPVTRSSIVGSSFATTLSVHSGPTFQCTHAPLADQAAFPTQMSSSAVENPATIPNSVLAEELGPSMKAGEGRQALNWAEGVKGKGVSVDACYMQPQVPLTSNPSSNVNMEPSQPKKSEKVSRKKKYDPDVFFKVAGKLYQKLGKIGSGGSSEVHKVISSDCTIYALKKIKLKGRDYPTAYGFCQEIEYLNKLKGKGNIIQLMDYEVTDKTLLQEVANGSMSIKDGRIKDDEYIYMVLEHGEIDLAHMLAQKWKDNSSSQLDENWLRFYWQQMLEAVNTIHEERIVHSDLKPANFLLVRGSLKLIDFGIAKAILSDTTNIQRDAQVGTLNYMSPEAFMWNEHDSNGNTIKCGRPSDIWSLGCILYQMVYGRTPFADYKTFWAKFKVITDRSHQIAYEQVSNPWLIDLMRRCLAWDRNERWRIPELLQHPFLVPPVPRTVPLPQDHPCRLLMQRVEVYWNDPKVSSLCLELHAVMEKLEQAQQEPSTDA